MKKMLIVASLLLSQASFAAIASSKLEARQQSLIKSAITESCGYFKDLTEVSTTIETIVVDNGVRDVKYTTVLTGLQRMDQNIFDQYEIVVKSEYADMYDHESQNWGVYSVSEVTCKNVQ